jgi:hypothetical protein
VHQSIDELLRVACFRREFINAVLDPAARSWIRFDPELGYVPAGIDLTDGVDGSRTRYTYEPGGHRRVVNGHGEPCRINTYGDSFTQCQQVSDGETWQEYLAAHLGEPIRNFGVGGYGVLQAVRRAARIEGTELAAPWVVLNVFDDDHIRSLDAARWLRTAWRMRAKPITGADQLHGLPWCHARYNPQRGEFVYLSGACSSPEDLLALCDAERFTAAFRNDQVVRLFALQYGIPVEFGDLEELAEAFGVAVNLRDPLTTPADAKRLHLEYGLRTSEDIVDWFRRYLEERGKRLFVLLSYGDQRLSDYLVRGERFDGRFVGFLRSRGIPFIDGLEKHRADFEELSLPVAKYLMRYFIQPAGAAVFGHYSPAGNHFFAFAVKPEVKDWLEPKPPAYSPP